MQLQPPHLICLGNLTVDDVYLPDGSLVPSSTGGDALYAALGARLWEPRVQMVAPIGNNLPQRTEQAIAAAGFRFDGMPIRDLPTLHNQVHYHKDGTRRWKFLFPEENFYKLSPTPEDIPAEYLNAKAFLLLAMALEAQEALIPFLRRKTNAIIALDTQEDYVAGNEARVLALLKDVDIFMPSTSETFDLLGHRDWLKAAKDFAQRGPRIVVIKQGAHGSLIFDRQSGHSFSQPPAPVEVVDTTGAGDAYCGGFVAGFLQQEADLTFAAQAGAVSASYAIASFGMDALNAADVKEASARLNALAAGRVKIRNHERNRTSNG